MARYRCSGSAEQTASPVFQANGQPGRAILVCRGVAGGGCGKEWQGAPLAIREETGAGARRRAAVGLGRKEGKYSVPCTALPAHSTSDPPIVDLSVPSDLRDDLRRPVRPR
jgi:hypothetical protein